MHTKVRILKDEKKNVVGIEYSNFAESSMSIYFLEDLDERLHNEPEAIQIKNNLLHTRVSNKSKQYYPWEHFSSEMSDDERIQLKKIIDDLGTKHQGIYVLRGGTGYPYLTINFRSISQKEEIPVEKFVRTVPSDERDNPY